MTDARLRELQRSESADLETQVRLLRERMRAGELTEERVRLAAYLGDEAAGDLSGDLAIDAPPKFRSWIEWLRPDQPGVEVAQLLSRYGEMSADGIVKALGGSLVWGEGGCLQLHSEAGPTFQRLKTRGYLSAHENGYAVTPLGVRWLRASTGLHVETAYQRAQAALYRLAMPHWAAQDPGDWRPRKLLEALEDWILCPCESCSKGVSFWNKRETTILHAVEFATSIAEAAFSAVRDELIPWALGLRDPVGERVAAREAGE